MAVEGIGVAAAMIEQPVGLADWLVIAPVAVGITFGAALVMVRQRVHLHPAIAMLGLAIMALCNAALLWRVLDSGPLVMTMGRWLPPFGISFTADALGASFALVASLVALVCCGYARRDITMPGRRYGFYPFLMLMMAGVSGAFLTGDIFNLYVWFEVFLISSFGLLVLGTEKAQFDGATKYAILNLIATALFLIATAYLYGSLGTLNMADIAQKGPGLRDLVPLTSIATLYLLAFAMKAAAFPVNFWLPASYHTPRIVVAALFGGLLTKVGVYALLRTLVMLFPLEREALSGVIGWMAVATMLVGALGALAQTDVRRLVGFTIISGVGIMLAGLALGTAEAVAGAIVYAVHSMIVVAALYLLAGMMRVRGGSFSLAELGGLYRASPALAALALLLFFSVAGLPPGSGLWPKVMLVEASLATGQWPLAAAILVSGLLLLLALARVFLLAFWRERAGGGQSGPRPASWPLFALTAATVAIGLYPEPLIRIASIAALGLLDPTAYVAAVFPPVSP